MMASDASRGGLLLKYISRMPFMLPSPKVLVLANSAIHSLSISCAKFSCASGVNCCKASLHALKLAEQQQGDLCDAVRTHGPALELVQHLGLQGGAGLNLEQRLELVAVPLPVGRVRGLRLREGRHLLKDGLGEGDVGKLVLRRPP